MILNLNRPTFALDAGEVVSLHDVVGTRISARLGTLWVTCQGSRKDVILAPGESVIVSRSGRTVVQALQPAFVSLQ